MNKLVWITGASSGIGQALALEFARHKYRLLLSARRKEALEQTASLCHNAGSPHCEAVVLDMTDAAAISATAQKVLEKHGKVDILVNNAGLSQRSLIKDTDVSVYRDLMEANFFGVVHLTQALLPAWRQSGGQVVVISSLTGKFATPFRAGYAASKHALHGYFDALRAEHHKEGLGVSIICPGFIKTNLSKKALTGNGSPLGKMDEAQFKGMPVEKFARKAYRAIRAEKAEAYIGGREKAGIYLSKYWPALFRKVIRKVAVR